MRVSEWQNASGVREFGKAIISSLASTFEKMENKTQSKQSPDTGSNNLWSVMLEQWDQQSSVPNISFNKCWGEFLTTNS